MEKFNTEPENKNLDTHKPESNKLDPNSKEVGKSDAEPVKQLDLNIDTDEVSIDELRQQAVEDLKAASEYPETIDFSKLENATFERIPQELYDQRRKHADSPRYKESIRKGWEEEHGIPWPCYKEDVYDENGKLIHYAGERYEIHHIVPIRLGGTGGVDNITPLPREKHQDIHNGAMKKIMNVVKENKE